MRDDYKTFLKSKAAFVPTIGIESECDLSPCLFGFQADIVRWALRRGRAAIFAGCGMGKTLMQLEWARHIPGRVLILAPLAVAQQTVREGERFNIPCTYARNQDSANAGERITVANYEMLEHFDAAAFAGVVLDESSILKAFMGKTKRAILSAFERTRYKLACTATPAPNDHMELGNHAEFVGVMKSSEMLAKYFINDPAHVGHYRLKYHAETPFWRWLASWAVMIQKPSDLGYPDEGFALPPLNRQWHVVDAAQAADGFLFALPAASLSERISARRNSVGERVDKAVELANGNAEQWIVWCALNAESEALAKRIDGAREVRGSDSIESKVSAMLDFVSGKVRTLVSKPSICGFGMNFQCAHNMAFVGLSDSWEQYYQALRREWRFGQKHPVNVHIITASTEGAVVQNILRKEADAERMAANLTREISYISTGEMRGSGGFKQSYLTDRANISLPDFLCPQS
jgi:superfamily II DNA or RNA helicase